MHNLFSRTVAKHDTEVTTIGKPIWNKGMCEEKARLTAVATRLAREAVEAGLPESVVKERWLNEWIAGSNAHL